MSLVHGAEQSFTADEAEFGFAASVMGIEGVEAIAHAAPGGTGGGAVVDQALIRNRVAEQDIRRRVLIQHAFQENRGILAVNQDSGNFNTQANVRVLALAEGKSLVEDVHVEKSARLIRNTLVSSGGEREDRITNSFGGTVGIVGVNQSSGNLNLQANVLVLGIGVALGPEVFALGDATLGEISTDNRVKHEGTAGPRGEVIADSFAGFRGIAQVSQSSGDLNAMGNFVGLSLTTLNVP